MNRAVWNAHSGSKKSHAGTLLLSFSNKLPQQCDFLSLAIHTTGAMWTLSGVGVVFFHYCYFLSIYPVTQEISSEDTIFVRKEGEIFHVKGERKQPRIAHRSTLWLVSCCLCHLVLCARCELPAWNGCVCCHCDTWSCGGGHSSTTTPTQTTGML